MFLGRKKTKANILDIKEEEKYSKENFEFLSLNIKIFNIVFCLIFFLLPGPVDYAEHVIQGSQEGYAV